MRVDCRMGALHGYAEADGRGGQGLVERRGTGYGTFVFIKAPPSLTRHPSAAPILVVLWLFFSGILFINLFIAMMSNTFQVRPPPSPLLQHLPKPIGLCQYPPPLPVPKPAHGGTARNNLHSPDACMTGITAHPVAGCL